MRVLMVGATGRYAHLVVPELVKRGVAVRALVRSEQRAEVARANGATDTVIGDLSDPRSLAAAVAGLDGVFHIGPAFAPNEAELGVAMVDAARAAGVRKFVFSGVIHPSISAMVNHRAKVPVEEALYTSGMDFTVLQPAAFMQKHGADLGRDRRTWSAGDAVLGVFQDVLGGLPRRRRGGGGRDDGRRIELRHIRTVRTPAASGMSYE
ncbi:MAG TPA: NmrA family NAD(P)-binding protein [Mycobacterium sp.]|nr:NmrA family NAD(P)-binding protein [Mycobacterium sp.]HUH69152.1 NmrA family NAD(P)-binding protein [Mycobacterium sp.]